MSGEVGRGYFRQRKPYCKGPGGRDQSGWREVGQAERLCEESDPCHTGLWRPCWDLALQRELRRRLGF